MKTIKEKIAKVAQEYAERESGLDYIGESAVENAFKAGADFALSHQWIDVEDALPEIDKEVLSICEYGTCIGYLDSTDMWLADGFGEVLDVIYWMPIPSLPEINNN